MAQETDAVCLKMLRISEVDTDKDQSRLLCVPQ